MKVAWEYNIVNNFSRRNECFAEIHCDLVMVYTTYHHTKALNRLTRHRILLNLF